MLKSGILNPHINSLLSRVRHTNTLVIADRGFPSWRGIEIVDISLIDDVPRVLEVLAAIRANFNVGRAFMAEEFQTANSKKTRLAFERALEGTSLLYEPHIKLERTRSSGHRAHPNRGHDTVRQHGAGVRLTGPTPPPPPLNQ